MHILKPSAEPLGWKRSFFWLTLAVVCFHLAYISLKFPTAGLLIFGYAFGLVQLTDQPSVKRAFYFGLATGFLCAATTTIFLLENFWRRRDCALARVRLLDRTIHGDYLRRNPALGKSSGDVADSVYLDGYRIFSQ